MGLGGSGPTAAQRHRWRLLGACCLLAMQRRGPIVAGATDIGGGGAERNNWAVLVDTSRYWYNYRHVANVLSFYHTVKRLGIPDNQIILMLAEDVACNPRNSKPGTVFNEMHHKLNLYGEQVEVDYRGDEVSVENFLRLLTGRHPPNTPRSKRLLTDSMSNIFIFITGHSGEEFIKFQDWEEITSTDLADAFAQMHAQRRYKNIFWVSDTCQAATLQNQFYSPDIMAFGSSGKKQNSYSHHADHELGIAIIDRFTYFALNFLNRVTPSSTETIKSWENSFNHKALHSNPELRSDLFSRRPGDVLLTEFLASTGRMRFQTSSLQLVGGPRPAQSSGLPSADFLWGVNGGLKYLADQGEDSHDNLTMEHVAYGLWLWLTSYFAHGGHSAAAAPTVGLMGGGGGDGGQQQQQRRRDDGPGVGGPFCLFWGVALLATIGLAEICL